jgi:molybdate transport system substrate-binding protein
MPAAGSGRRRATLGVLAAAGAAWLPARSRSQGGAPLVAAASSLTFALPEIAEAFTGATGHRVQMAYGSSGNFARQIVQGAPYELFLSADEASVDTLVQAGRTRDAGAVYATGRLALLAGRATGIEADGQLRGVRVRLASIRRFAIANPETAPYGRAAREVLVALGLWDTLSSRIVRAENVAAAAQFVATGAADAGLVAGSLLAAGRGETMGRFAPIDPALHAPLRQRMVLLRGAGPVAASFHDWLQQPLARATFARQGFGVPAGA